jgi:peptidoglycan-associated lipoprotein
MANWRKLLWFSWILAGIVALACAAACGGKPTYPACDGDSDCKKPERCVNKKCVQCLADADCGPGKACSAGECKPLPGYCDDDSGCSPFEVCKEHKCTFCASDTECGVGGKCKSGKCFRPGMCEKDTDCAEDEDCVNNRCTKYQRPTANLPTCPLDPVFFGFDVYTLSDEAKKVLEKDYDCLNANKNRNFAVVGYTDPRGTVEYNIGLSDDRAQAVATYLARFGIDPARIHKVPKGSAEAKGTDESGWAKDRRVEFVWE